MEDSIIPINKNEIPKEMIEKAMQCETADELIALAKSEGMELTKEEAEAYLAELADVELDGETLKKLLVAVVIPIVYRTLISALPRAEGIELTKEEAEAYLAELDDFELDDATLKNAFLSQRLQNCRRFLFCSLFFF
jgi:ribosomal protein L12E/L44/L45/RPP1/RPP2